MAEAPGVNMRCIVFTLALAGGYWYLPPRNKWVLLTLLYFPYLAMAWYDAHLNCDRQLGATFLHHFYAWGKGDHYVESWQRLHPAWRSAVTLIDLALLALLFALAPRFARWQPA